MNLQIQLLRRFDYLRHTLRADGWTIEVCPENCLLVGHPGVADDDGARERLDHLGLLTAGCLRIEFGTRPTAFTEV
jgi:hypothetical protein